MLANDLKKGDKVVMTNGWDATIEDNKRGNIRMATVEGIETEMGSVYIWDIKGRVAVEDKAKQGVEYLVDFGSGKMLETIDLTAAQVKAKGRVNAWGF